MPGLARWKTFSRLDGAPHRARVERERPDLVTFVAWVNLQPWADLVLGIPMGAHSSPYVGAKMKKEGCRKGSPDILGLIPNRNSHGFALEFKSADGRLSDDQLRMLSRLSHQGYACAAVRNFEDAKRFVTRYMYGKDWGAPRPLMKREQFEV
jgi:VRR-NUC domain-containing protein